MTIRNEERAAETWTNDGGNDGGNHAVANETRLYSAKTFQIPELKGISRKNIQEHLELYSGYVKYTNEILNRIHALPQDEESAYERTILQRRFAYEYDGMRNHETYFNQFEGGPAGCTTGGSFLKQVSKDFESFNAFLTSLKNMAMTRGVGWAMLYYCHSSGRLLPQWVDEHHIGLLAGPKLLFALDMWEHAFVYDYTTREKAKYIDAVFNNLNWTAVERRFQVPT